MDAFIACLLGFTGLVAFVAICTMLYAVLGILSAPITAVLVLGIFYFLSLE